MVVDEIDAELAEYEVDAEATEREREQHPRQARAAGSRRTREASPRATAPASSTCSTSSASYGVILDWGTGELLPKTTRQFRAMIQRRAASKWED